MITVIKNTYPVSENGVCTVQTNLLIKDGIIADTSCKDIPKNASVVDADGGYTLAGFVDLHVHGGGNADFMDGNIDAFKTVTETHIKHGTTSLCPTSMTATEKELACFIQTYKDFLKTENKGSKTLGLHLEGPYLSGGDKKSAGAQKADLLRTPDKEEILRLLDLANGNIARWDCAPEIENADIFADLMKKNNIICAVAHTSATGEETLKGFDMGFSHVTHFYNAVTAYRKVGQNVLSGAVEATYLNDNVTIELICDGKHVPKECLKLALKIKGPKKVSAITDAMRLAGTDLKSGKLGSSKYGRDVIVDDGVAKLPDMSSYAGSICTMDRCLRVLCKKYDIPLHTASQMLSLAPAITLGVDKNIGSIKVGKCADLVVVDMDLNVKHVFKDGNMVSSR